MPPAARPARVAGTSETAMLKRLFKASAIALLLSGCERQQDRAFRSAVVPMLGQADDLLGTLGGLKKAPEAEQAQTSQLVKGYIDAVDALPQPTEKKLRYLRIRLAVLGIDAGKEVIGHLQARTGSVYSEPESVSVEKYREDLGLLAVAERVALGTSLVHDRLFAGALKFQYTEQLDSIIRADEAVVRKELRSLR
jgi:hypothetical protein